MFNGETVLLPSERESVKRREVRTPLLACLDRRQCFKKSFAEGEQIDGPAPCLLEGELEAALTPQDVLEAAYFGFRQTEGVAGGQVVCRNVHGDSMRRRVAEL